MPFDQSELGARRTRVKENNCGRERLALAYPFGFHVVHDGLGSELLRDLPCAHQGRLAGGSLRTSTPSTFNRHYTDLPRLYEQ